MGHTGTVLGERVFRHGGAGLAEMADWIATTAGAEPGVTGVAIEVPHSPVVETLMERGFAVHSINPKQLDRFRDRFSPAGAKDDAATPACSATPCAPMPSHSSASIP